MLSEFTTEIAASILASIQKSSPDEKHSAPQALKIAFGIVFKQLAVQFSFLMASIFGTNGNSFIPLSVALLTDRDVCHSGDHPVAFSRKLALPI